MTGSTGPTLPIPARQFRDGAWNDAFIDDVAIEERVTLAVEAGPSRELWAHPVDLPHLALGHARLEWCGAGLVPELVRAQERAFTLRLVPDPGPAPDPRLPLAMAAMDVRAAMRAFIDAKGLWDGTGCFHRAAAYDTRAKAFVRVAEDIGRHNCLDRLAGWATASGRPLAELALFVTARMTASLFTKALACGFRLVVSRSAVTTASLEMARAAGVTLVGFAREAESRFTLFNDPEGRILR